VEGSSGACQGCVGSLPRADCSPDSVMHECHVYRLQAVRGEAMSQLMGLVESTKITMDNREDLVVDLSTELVEKDLQVEQMATQIQELEEQVGARENTIEVLEDQLLTT
jgi:signal recognition particle GTPase